MLLIDISENIIENYHQPWEWDFLVFWADGNVAHSGGNFYDPVSYQNLSFPYDVTDGFRKEILDVGFKYPPFTMFLFLPLSFFEVSHAYLLWQLVNGLLCGVCIFLIWEMFLKKYGKSTILLVTLLFLSLYPTYETFIFAQTNFWNLLFFLIFWRYREKLWGGLWATLCLVVKPYMAILYLYLFLARKWKALSVALLTFIAAILLSVIAFGSEIVISFFKNPIPATPLWNYTEATNQSLLATILRFSQFSLGDGSAVLNPWYLGGAVLLTLITIAVAIKNSDSKNDWIILSFIFLALLVYPANQRFYSVFIILPVVMLLRQTSWSVMGKIAILFAIVATYFLTWMNGGESTFWANAVMWLVCIASAMELGSSKLNFFNGFLVRG